MLCAALRKKKGALAIYISEAGKRKKSVFPPAVKLIACCEISGPVGVPIQLVNMATVWNEAMGMYKTEPSRIASKR